MKTKLKRIRALVRSIADDGWIGRTDFHDTQRCYVIRQSDIRALAEQFVDDAEREMHNPKHKLRCRLDTALHVLKRAGMAPGKGTQ